MSKAVQEKPVSSRGLLFSLLVQKEQTTTRSPQHRTILPYRRTQPDLAATRTHHEKESHPIAQTIPMVGAKETD